MNKVISYIGAIMLGAGFVYGIKEGFTEWVSLELIISAICFACGFIGGKESIPEDEK